MSLLFYTVCDNRSGFSVKYVSLDTQVTRFPGSFVDPGEASQAFQAQAGSTCCFLSPPHFQCKARALAALRRKRKV
jgi:hypothetical protein